MKAKKWITIITGIIFVITFVSIIILFLVDNSNSELVELMSNICLAIFGSALLGFIMSLTEYFAEKQKAMETFYIESKLVLREFYKAKFFYTDEPLELVKACFGEQWSNGWNKYSNKNDKKEAKSKLISYFKEQHNFSQEDVENDNNLLESWYSEKTKEYDEKFIECINSFITISDIDLKDLDNAYGNLDFIFGNKKFRGWIYNNIYSKIRSSQNIAKDNAYHFKTYLASTKGNKFVNLTFLLKLCGVWFERIDATEGKNHSITTITPKLAYELDDNIEKYLCKIYNQDFKPIEKIPIFSVQKLLDWNNEESLED